MSFHWSDSLDKGGSHRRPTAGSHHLVIKHMEAASLSEEIVSVGCPGNVLTFPWKLNWEEEVCRPQWSSPDCQKMDGWKITSKEKKTVGNNNILAQF